jgi:hypothetical protein
LGVDVGGFIELGDCPVVALDVEECEAFAEGLGGLAGAAGEPKGPEAVFGELIDLFVGVVEGASEAGGDADVADVSKGDSGDSSDIGVGILEEAAELDDTPTSGDEFGERGTVAGFEGRTNGFEKGFAVDGLNR